MKVDLTKAEIEKLYETTGEFKYRILLEMVDWADVELAEKIAKLVDILVKWNAKEVDSRNACYKIYLLFEDEVKPAWQQEMKRREKLWEDEKEANSCNKRELEEKKQVE